jgi:hypothetical protein
MRRLAASVSTVSGTGVGEFFDAYFNRVGGMLEGMADSFSASIDFGLQAKGSVTLPLNIKGEASFGCPDRSTVSEIMTLI